MQPSIRVLFLFLILIFASIYIVSAAPSLTIQSPGNVTYGTTKVLANITSNETVDFFYKDTRGRRILLEQNTTFLETYIYFQEGTYEFKIWANNSEGETNASVVFSTTAHNPVSITDCGYLYASDTAYVLNNDIGTTSFRCLWLPYVRNVTLDLNGYTVSSGYYDGISLSGVSDVEVFNGAVNGTPDTGVYPWVFQLDGSRMRFSNLTVDGAVGFSIWTLHNVIFENVSINSSVGFYYYTITGVYFINSSFTWNGYDAAGVVPPTAFWDTSDHSEVFLENTTITGFPDYDFYLDGGLMDVYVRNTDLNLSRISYPSHSADARIFEQHHILINVTDQINESGSGVVEIVDDGVTVPRLTGYDALIETLINPTSDLLIATDDDGYAEVWLTEKITLGRSSSPVNITEYDFSPYTLVARSWNSNATAHLNLTHVNSTIPISIQLEVPTELPECTIADMLDLNNDGSVDTKDALIVIRYKIGHDVSFNSTKSCTGINLNPF